ncbi:MAG TPA: hypothetical protein VE195_04735 [Acidobacteriaceae bacterium]|nr:hypothetical protein [Acidobacteriaceae bacterium]
MSETSESPSAVRSRQKVELLVTDTPGSIGKGYALLPYNPERQHDHVRMVVTVGLMALFGFVIIWVALKSSRSDDVWRRTKEMLQIVLPALTALLGSVIGFYFGTQRNNPLAR